MSDPALSDALTARILEHLGVDAGPRSTEHLQRLLDAYARSVPWESASRIARRLAHTTPSACANWPHDFWRDSMDRGTGGTCFESNYAFLALLRALGYEGRLTVNDMGDMHACHSALIVEMLGGPVLVDVGIPIHAPVRLDPARPTTAESPFHRYTVVPISHGVYQVERDRHPRPYIYTLFDRAVDNAFYREVLTNDYDAERGLFLDRVIVSKVIGGGQHRFCSGDLPWCIELFVDGARTTTPLGDDPAGDVAAHFGMDLDIIRAAWPIVPSNATTTQ